MTITTAEHLLSRTHKAFTYEDRNGKVHFLLVNARVSISIKRYRWALRCQEHHST